MKPLILAFLSKRGLKFFVFFVLFTTCLQLSYAQPETIVARLDVTSDFTFTNNNTCSGTSIQFTSMPANGTAPFTYSWNFGDGSPLSNLQDPTHTYTALGCATATFNVRLTVTDATGATATIQKQIMVKQTPDVGIRDQNFPFNPFSNCNNNPTLANPNYTITVGNNSPNSSCINSYSINWGDGQSQNNISFPITHTYTQLGAYNLVITAVGSNGCSNSKTYIVANQSNPGATFGTVPNTTLNRCAPADIPLVISNWQGNSPGTTYVLNFGDGTPILTLTHPLANDTIVHIYTTSSCPSTTYTVTLNVINACSNTPYSAGNIQVRIKPKPSFTFPDAVCVGSSNCFTNTSIPGSSGSNCVNQTIYTWDFGDGTSTSTINAPCHVYTSAGTYIVKLFASNGCGTDTFTKPVCVRLPPTASFTTDKHNVCAPDTVVFTNTSPIGNCGGETYGWSVLYQDVQNCGNTVGYSFVGSATTRDAKIRFTNPGRYIIILTETAAATGCTPATSRDTILVSAKPKITLASSFTTCINNSISHTAIISSCYSITNPVVNWTFGGGNPSSFNNLNPGPIQYDTLGNFPLMLTAQNECGLTTATATTIITSKPDAKAGPDTTICSGTQVVIGLNTQTTYTYSWNPTTGLNNPISPRPTLTYTYNGPSADTTLMYILTVSAGASCTNKDTVLVKVKKNPVITVAPASATICSGTSVTLIATGATSYLWAPPATLNVNNQDTVIASPTANITYTVTGTLNGCLATKQVPVTIITVPTPNAGPDTSFCNISMSVQLLGTPAGGVWSGHPNLTPGGTFNPNAAGNGAYTFYYTTSSGTCSRKDSAAITVTSGDTARAGADFTICQQPGTLQLNGSPAGGSWSGSPIITPAGVFNTNLPGTYTLIYRIGSGSCISRDTIVITVNSGITNNSISANQALCSGAQPPVIIGQTISGGNGTPQYVWEFSLDSLSWNPVMPAATGQHFTPPPVTQTIYYRRKASTTLCSGAQSNASLPVKITLNPDARAVFNPTDSVGCIPFNITAAIINHTPFNTAVSQYNWYVNGTLYSTSQTFPVYIMSIAGDTATIKLVAISRFGCKNDSVQHGFKTVLPPAPAFTQSDSVGCGPLSITFTNLTPNASQYTYQWIFGMGANSNAQQPAAVNFPTNPQGGDTVYTVQFITISQCKRDTLLRYVRVKSKPKALFTPDRTTGCSSYNFTFTNTSRSSGTTSYIWDFGDGTTLPSNAAQVNHVYTVGNTTTFRVKLKATNECGTDSLIYNLLVTPITIRPDFAINGNESFGCLPHTVSFINNSQGGTLYTINFGDGSAPVSGFNGIDTIRHTYTDTGVFTVKLRATNSCSDTTDIEYITVRRKPIVAFTATPLIGCASDTIRFTNSSDTAISYNWHFGDGGTSFTRNTTHIYTTGGTFRTWLTGRKIYTGGSCADSAFKDIVIRDTLAGSFTAGTVSATCLPASISFVNDNRPAALTTWTFGDGGTATGDSVNHTYTQAGTYTVRMISKGIAGCTYTATRTINIVGLSGTLQYNSGYLCPGIPLRMEVQSTTATQIRYFFGNGDSLTTTNAIINYTYPQPGIYVPYAYLLSANCLLRLNVGDTVKVDRLRTGFRIATQQTCGRTTVSFTDTSNAFFGIRSWLWSFGDGTTSNQQNPVHTYTQNGIYQVRLRITGNSNCVDTITIPVTVAVRNYPVSTIAGDTVACIGQPLALAAIVQSADAIVSYNWDFGNGTPGTGQNVTAVYNTIGTYTVRLITRTAFGCADTVYKTVRSNNSPIVSAGPDVNICRGQSIQIGAIGATTWQWSPLQGLSCTICANPVANPLFTTNYIVTGSFGALCRANDTIQVRVIQPFDMTVSPTTTVCIGDSVPLFATGAYTYSWSPAISLNNANLSNPTAKPIVTTLYQVIGRDNFNCFTDTDYVRVNVGQYPTVDLGNGATVVAGTAITLNPTVTNGPITTYRWTPPTLLSCSNCPRPVATINNNISYKLEAENAFGCIGSDTISFRVNCDPNQLFIPNAFSPDGDGTNDVLMVRGKGISAVKYFRVFNRWGQLVFERSNINVNDAQQGWDGRINGVPAQPDVYVYTAEAVCTAGGTFVYKGNVTLVR